MVRNEEIVLLSAEELNVFVGGDSWADWGQWFVGQAAAFGARLIGAGAATVGILFSGAGTATLISSECRPEYGCFNGLPACYAQ